MGRYRTPLRYPGGKQRLSPFILELLELNEGIGGHYVEPYAGGAGVALELLLEDQVSQIHLNDSSAPIFAFWKSVLSQPEEFCRLISRASLTVDEWKRRREMVRNPSSCDELELGFSAFFLNRCNRSGVLAGGLIGGLSQVGKWRMDARFPRNELIRRIEAIAVKRDAIHIQNLDAEDFILGYVDSLPRNTLVYCDPPYFGKSNRLYLDRYNESDHCRIAEVIQQGLSKKWVVSYDGVGQVVGYYSGRRHFSYGLRYNASRSYLGTEVLIFSDDLKLPTISALPFINDRLSAAGAPL